MSMTLKIAPRRFTVKALGALSLAFMTSSSLASAFGWILGEDVVGSGKIEHQVRPVTAYNAINLGIPAELELRIGSVERVTIDGDDNLIGLIEASVDRGTLVIKSKKKSYRLKPTSLKIIVEARQIDALTISDSGHIWANQLNSPDLNVSLGGGGAIRISSLKSSMLRVQLGGSGTFEAAGVTNSVSAAIGGDGALKIGRLDAREVSLSLGGSGNAVVWAKDMLRMSLAGSGSVSYYGDPQIGNSSTGSVTVARLGAAPN